MANEELGTKRDCPECGARFYDLKRDPAVCPKCAHEFVPELILKPRRPRPDDEVAKPKAQTETEDDEEEDYVAEKVPSLDEADEENAPAKTKRKSALDDDEDEDDSDEEGIKDVEGIGVIDVNIDEEDDDTLIDDEDDGTDHLSGMVTTTGEDDDR